MTPASFSTASAQPTLDTPRHQGRSSHTESDVLLTADSRTHEMKSPAQTRIWWQEASILFTDDTPPEDIISVVRTSVQHTANVSTHPQPRNELKHPPSQPGADTTVDVSRPSTVSFACTVASVPEIPTQRQDVEKMNKLANETTSERILHAQSYILSDASRKARC